MFFCVFLEVEKSSDGAALPLVNPRKIQIGSTDCPARKLVIFFFASSLVAKASGVRCGLPNVICLFPWPKPLQLRSPLARLERLLKTEFFCCRRGLVVACEGVFLRSAVRANILATWGGFCPARKKKCDNVIFFVNKVQIVCPPKIFLPPKFLPWNLN